ncbi:class I SAM-dependent methyltransferase [Dokdonella soli]
MSVLEIGCGTWSKIKDHCQMIGSDYHGLDVLSEYYGIPTIATRLENLAELSYSDESFDIVVGNQTMEHWGEHGCTLEWGLYQCFRVTKIDGLVLLNVPIHFHGTKEFVHGRLDVMRDLFSKFSNSATMERWGSPTDPLPPYYPHPDYEALRGKPAYVLDIRASRDRAQLPRASNALGFHGKLAQIFHYSASYNSYRLMKKLRGLRSV